LENLPAGVSRYAAENTGIPADSDKPTLRSRLSSVNARRFVALEEQVNILYEAENDNHQRSDDPEKEQRDQELADELE
jgi:hypothetical protein